MSTPATQPWPGTFYPESPEQITAARESRMERLEDEIRAALARGRSIDITTGDVILLQEALRYESSFTLSSHFGCRIDWTVPFRVRFMPSRRKPDPVAETMRNLPPCCA